MSKVPEFASVPDAQDIHGSWCPRWRTLGVLLLALTGAGLVVYTTIEPKFFLGAGGPGRFFGLMLLAGALLLFFVTVVIPAGDRKSASSPIIIGIDSNRLYFEGRGKYAGGSRLTELSGDAVFSTPGHYIADAEALTKAVEGLIVTLNTRSEPFVAVMPLEQGEIRTLTKVERQLIALALGDCQVMGFTFLKSGAPLGASL